MNEQGKNPPDQTNEEEIGSLPEKEFRVMIVKKMENHGKRMEKIQETFNKNLEQLKSKRTMMNNTINEIKNSRPRREDGGKVRRGDHLPSHRYSRNTSTRGTAPTEHPLNAGRKRQTSQKARNSPRTWVGQKKKEIRETKE